MKKKKHKIRDFNLEMESLIDDILEHSCGDSWEAIDAIKSALFKTLQDAYGLDKDQFEKIAEAIKVLKGIK